MIGEWVQRFHREDLAGGRKMGKVKNKEAEEEKS